ncbi:ankyrin repeat domain-containing protein [Streptomyces sp. NPDC056663]|uniref:ankyrin repeat domain-containing protein n=1 Tax=Streptomyces sp. NPDC056663 TaxID=3345899 RepID=UPI0036B8A4AB
MNAAGDRAIGMGTGASRTTDGGSALISAVRAGDTALVKSLLQEDSDPDMREAAFRLAVRTYAGEIAQLLLQHGADAGQSSPDELLPLREAVASGSPALVERLLDHRIRGRYPESEQARVPASQTRYFRGRRPERDRPIGIDF